MYAFLADVHLGVKLPKDDFHESLLRFLNCIKANKEPCHAIFVCGDLFDHRLSIEDAKFAAFFIRVLCENFCGKGSRQHVPVYFVHGTFSHDQAQYQIFTDIIQHLPNVHLFVIEKACVSPLIDTGVKCLFLPQEYGDVDYGKLLEDQYDLIVGHGPIASTTKNPCKSAKYEIVHSAEQLGKISKLCVFGHYHGFTDFGNNVYYAGPWLRWKYGEDEPRVFFFCDDNFKVFTEPNGVAKEFETVEIHNPEELREYTSQQTDHPVRFMIESSQNDMETYRGIINSNKSDPNLKFQLTEIIDEDDLGLTVDEVIEAQMEAVQPVPALVSFIKDKYGIDAEEQLHEYESQINKEEPKNG